MKSLLFLFALGLSLPLAPPGQDKQKENYDSGKLKAEYSVDKDGKKHGRYTEYYESGKKRISGDYNHGDRTGEWWEYYETGRPFGKKSFAKGKPAGDVVRMDAKGMLVYRATLGRDKVTVYPDFRTPEPAYDRSLDEIRKKIEEIDPVGARLKLQKGDEYEEKPSAKPPYKAGKLKTAYLEDALKHLNVYRYLSGLLPTVKLDPGYTDHCQHATVVMAANKGLSHEPPKPPDMDAAFYAKGYKGCSSSNIHEGQSTMRQAVDGFMEDSGDNNKDHVGHRAWIQNPGMGKTGFGACNGFIALWSFDEGGRPSRPDLIGYPVRGYHPVEYFGREPVWSMGPQGKYRLPGDKELGVRVWLLDEEFDFTQELEIGHKIICTEGGFGLRAVFHPRLPKGVTWENQRVWVLFLKGDAPAFGYFTHIVSLKPKEPAPADSKEDGE